MLEAHLGREIHNGSVEAADLLLASTHTQRVEELEVVVTQLQPHAHHTGATCDRGGRFQRGGGGEGGGGGRGMRAVGGLRTPWPPAGCDPRTRIMELPMRGGANPHC